MSKFECIPPQNPVYVLGDKIEIRFQVINNYDEEKVIVCRIYKCQDEQCTTGQLIAVSNEITVPPGGPYSLVLTTSSINSPGYYAIIVHNKTDGKDECGFVIQVITQMEYIMQQVFNFIPAVMGMSVAIAIAKEMGEALSGIGGGG